MKNPTLTNTDTIEGSTLDESSILKVDPRGRIRYSQDQRELILDAFEDSGLSAKRFAKHHGISYSTFQYWKKKRVQVAKPPQNRFVELAIESPTPGCCRPN